MDTVYSSEPVLGLDDDVSRQWLQLNQTRRRHPLGVLLRFWSEPMITTVTTIAAADDSPPGFPPEDDDSPDGGGPPKRSDFGRTIHTMRWKNFDGFITLLRAADNAEMQRYADTYCAYVRSYNAFSDLTSAQVLRVWHRHLAAF